MPVHANIPSYLSHAEELQHSIRNTSLERPSSAQRARARWAMLLPPSIQVCPVEIPGRGRREGEPAPSDAAALARLLARSLPLQARVIPRTHHPDLSVQTARRQIPDCVGPVEAAGRRGTACQGAAAFLGWAFETEKARLRTAQHHALS